MDSEYVRPFVRHTVNTFEVMLGVSPEERSAESKADHDNTFDISAIIGISGSASGAIVMSFPDEVARKVVARMVGQDSVQDEQEVIDGVGELVNIVAGNTREDLVQLGLRDLRLSLPSVIVGRHRAVWRSEDLPCLAVYFFNSELGQFSVEVGIRTGG